MQYVVKIKKKIVKSKKIILYWKDEKIMLPNQADKVKLDQEKFMIKKTKRGVIKIQYKSKPVK